MLSNTGTFRHIRCSLFFVFSRKLSDAVLGCVTDQLGLAPIMAQYVQLGLCRHAVYAAWHCDEN